MGANTTSGYQQRPKIRNLTGDMSRSDLVEVLERLQFRDRYTGRGDTTCLLRLDSPVRDYILRALRRET